MNDIRYPFQDRTIDVAQRTDDLLSRMSLEDKVGQMFHPMTQVGEDLDSPGVFDSPSTQSILDSGITHMNILTAPSARSIAQWHNRVQEVAEGRGLGIPLTISSDPRHSFSDNRGAALLAGPFSQWPEFIGFGALDDPELTRDYARIVREEYAATGIRVALHPQIDLASDPRWARASGTFGSSSATTTRLGLAYLDGLSGDDDAAAVSAMVKHFPGGGPQLDGEDPHFSYGREQVYPGDRFEQHLEPFRALIAAGARQIMPYYGVPTGTEYEEVGFGFNRQIITDLLRNELGFDGIVCSDWCILSMTCWGVEDLTYRERMLTAIDAGVDQFGGEAGTEDLKALVSQGKVSEARLDQSVRKLLREKFRLGLFDDSRYVDETAASIVVGSEEAADKGIEAQSAAMTVLTNSTDAAQLPLAPPENASEPAGRIKVYGDSFSPDLAGRNAQLVDTPEEADVAVARIKAPWEERGEDGTLESMFHAGSLEFSDDDVARLTSIAAHAPLVLVVHLERPAILTPLVDVAGTIVGEYGASDEAVARVLFGESEPLGHLPFELPRSMAAVAASRPDVPNDTEDPLFAYRHGLRIDRRVPHGAGDVASQGSIA